MVAKSKKYLITNGSHEIYIVRRNGNKMIRGFFPECEKDVVMLTLETALSLSGISVRQ